MKFFSNLFGKSELRPKEVGLIISPSLQEFVRTEVLPGLDISPHYFWSSFESLIDKFINRNNELLDKRNFKSPPPQNSFPLPVKIKTLIFLFVATIFVALYNSFANSMFKVLPASGLFKVILAILFDIEKSILLKFIL